MKKWKILLRFFIVIFVLSDEKYSGIAYCHQSKLTKVLICSVVQFVCVCSEGVFANANIWSQVRSFAFICHFKMYRLMQTNRWHLLLFQHLFIRCSFAPMLCLQTIRQQMGAWPWCTWSSNYLGNNTMT